MWHGKKTYPGNTCIQGYFKIHLQASANGDVVIKKVKVFTRLLFNNTVSMGARR